MNPSAAGLIIAGLMAAGAAGADPIAEDGWLTACDLDAAPAGCLIEAGGFALLVQEGQGTPDALITYLAGLPPVSAIHFEGEIVNMGDSTAELVLTTAAQVDNIHEGNLQALQGDWTPVGEETPFQIRIYGLEWQEWQGDEQQGAFAMVVGDACGDGTVPGAGTVISLYRLGDDPADDGCWQLEYIDDSRMTLRDFKGDRGQVAFTRVQP